MNHLVKPLIIGLAFAIFSCGSAEEQAQKALLEEVMAVHDEVMPKMGEVSSLRKDIRNKVDSLISDSLKVNDETAFELKKIVDQLGSANEGMMVWMRGFTKDFEGKSHEEIIDYLSDQKTKADKVKEDILKAIEAGRAAK